jgi:hypothetical protein
MHGRYKQLREDVSRKLHTQSVVNRMKQGDPDRLWAGTDVLTSERCRAGMVQALLPAGTAVAKDEHHGSRPVRLVLRFGKWCICKERR